MISDAGRLIPVPIVGEIFDTSNQGLDMLTGWRTVATADPRLFPATYDVGLRPGTDPRAYAAALGRSLGQGARSAQHRRSVLPDPDRTDRAADPAAGRVAG